MVLPPTGHPGGPVAIGAYEFACFWNGAIAFADQRRIEIAGLLPDGTPARAALSIVGPVGLLVAKACAAFGLSHDLRAKHLYDVFALLRAYSDRPEDFVRELQSLGPNDDVDNALDMLQVMFVEDDEGARLVAAMRATEGRPEVVLATEAQVTVRRFLRAAREAG